MRVIGIDPGTAIVGFGIVDFEKNKYTPIHYGVITTSKNLNMEDRLFVIFQELEKILNIYKPEYMAIEDLSLRNYWWFHLVSLL